MPLVDHLRELRWRLLACVVALVPGLVVGWVAFEPISTVLTAPVCDPAAVSTAPTAPTAPTASTASTAPDSGRCGPLVIAGGLLGPFSVRISVAVATAVALSAPVWLYQTWRFVTPGLYRHERRWSVGFLATSVPLFFAGGWLCWRLLPRATTLLLGIAPQDIGVLVFYGEYLTLVLRLVLVFGLAFEVPLFLVLLNLAGVLPAATLRRWWRGIVLGVVAFAAVATPTNDPVTMLGLALPLLALTGVAYLIARAHDARARRDDPYADLADDEASPPP